MRFFNDNEMAFTFVFIYFLSFNCMGKHNMYFCITIEH